jgi:hypothetical protein
MSQRAQQKQERKRRDPGASGSKTLTTPQGQQAVARRLTEHDKRATRQGQSGQQLGPTFHGGQNATAAAAPQKRLVRAEDGTWEFR